MKASKKRYDNKHKVTRIFLADYEFLKEFSRSAGISMAEALHKLITGPDHKEPVHPAQISMPVTMAELMPVTGARSMPVTSARSTPVTSARRRSTPVTISFAREVKANDHRQNANGHRQAD